MSPISAPPAVDAPVALRLEGSVVDTPLARFAAGARDVLGSVAALVQWHNHLHTIFCPDFPFLKARRLHSGLRDVRVPRTASQ